MSGDKTVPFKFDSPSPYVLRYTQFKTESLIVLLHLAWVLLTDSGLDSKWLLFIMSAETIVLISLDSDPEDRSLGLGIRKGRTSSQDSIVFQWLMKRLTKSSKKSLWTIAKLFDCYHRAELVLANTISRFRALCKNFLGKLTEAFSCNSWSSLTLAPFTSARFDTNAFSANAYSLNWRNGKIRNYLL